MENSPNLTDLIARWEQEGRPPLDVFCKGHPQLREDLEKAIAAQEQLTRLESTEEAGSHNGSSPRPSGRYRLTRVLGKGGYGEVWQGYDPVLDLVVAIKMPRSDRMLTEKQIECFVEEARKQARLDHPSIVKVRHAERMGPLWAIVTDYIDGGSLSEQIKHRLPTPEASARIVADLASALDVAHRHRLVHRDVKPGNILMDKKGKPYLADFGLALAEEDQLEEKDQIAGTLAYMSPEQIRGESHLLDGRSDIYSLGIVLYRLLTGEVPFKGKNYTDYREQILKREPKPPRAIVDSVPLELERICLKCLSKQITDRYATASDLESDLRRFLAGPSTTRWYWGAGLAGLCLLVILVLIQPEKKPADDALREETSKVPYAVSEDGWTPLWLKENLEKLDWPGPTANAYLDPRPHECAIWMGCNGDGMVKLGEIDNRTFRLRMTIQPPNWNCTIAVFLGHRTYTQGTFERSRFQLIRISPTFPEGRRVQYLLSRFAIRNYTRGPPQGPQLASRNIEEPRGGRKLEIVVKDDKLDHVLWDGDKFELQAVDKRQEMSLTGGFGVYIRNGSVRLHRPELKKE